MNCVRSGAGSAAPAPKPRARPRGRSPVPFSDLVGRARQAESAASDALEERQYTPARSLFVAAEKLYREAAVAQAKREAVSLPPVGGRHDEEGRQCLQEQRPARFL